jgi:hypothetical protein
MTQERFAKFVFSAIVVAVTAYWLWFIFTHADKIFRNGRLVADYNKDATAFLSGRFLCL